MQYFSAILIKLSAFLNGFQGGIGVCLVFMYLNEISPILIRGEIGMIAPLQFVFGLLVSQILGLNQLFGKESSWHTLLSLPAFIASIGLLTLLLFPESPKALILERNNIVKATKALKQLKNTQVVTNYINEILEERNLNSNYLIGTNIIKPYTKHLKKSWLISFVLHISVQFSGIYPVLNYSQEIFENAGISKNNLQYVNSLLCLVSLLTLILTIPLIDKFIGRKLLLLISIFFIIIDLVLMIAFTALKVSRLIFIFNFNDLI